MTDGAAAQAAAWITTVTATGTTARAVASVTTWAAVRAASGDVDSEHAYQTALLLDLVPDPERKPPPLRSSPRAVALATAIYRGHDFAGLPALGDLLEEDGVTDPEVLGHLRGPGPHARGCWALDAILHPDPHLEDRQPGPPGLAGRRRLQRRGRSGHHLRRVPPGTGRVRQSGRVPG